MNTTLKLLKMNIKDANKEASVLADKYQELSDLTEVDYTKEWTDEDYVLIEQHIKYMELHSLMLIMSIKKRRSYKLVSDLKCAVAGAIDAGCIVY